MRQDLIYIVNTFLFKIKNKNKSVNLFKKKTKLLLKYK